MAVSSLASRSDPQYPAINSSNIPLALSLSLGGFDAFEAAPVREVPREVPREVLLCGAMPTQNSPADCAEKVLG